MLNIIDKYIENYKQEIVQTFIDFDINIQETFLIIGLELKEQYKRLRR